MREEIKMNNWNKIWSVLVMMLFVLPAGFAGSGDALVQINWASEITDHLTVPQGQNAQVGLATMQVKGKYTVTLGVFQGVQEVLKVATITDNQSITKSYNINTTGLKVGDYLVKANTGTSSSTLKLTVTTPKDTTPPVVNNTAPTITVTPVVQNNIFVKTVDETFTVTFTGADKDNNTLTFSQKPYTADANYQGALPAGLTFNKDASKNVATITGKATKAGKYAVTVTVNDGQSKNNTAEANVFFEITEKNVAPVITNKINTLLNFNESVLGAFKVEANDANTNSNVTFKDAEICTNFVLCNLGFGYSTNLPDGMTFDKATGLLTYTPAFTAVKHPKLKEFFDLRFTATDGQLESSQFIAKVVVSDVNQKPTIAANPANPTTDENKEIKVTFTISDKDSEDKTSMKASVLPTGAKFNQATGILTWTPSFTQAGKHKVTLIADDGISTNLPEFEITVNNVNQKPVFKNLVDQGGIESEKLEFKVEATDADGDNLVYSAKNLPKTAKFDPATQTFSWTPAFGDAGEYKNVEFTVTDNTDAVTETITIIIKKGNQAPTLAVIGDKTVDEGKLLAFKVVGNDPDGDVLTYDYNWGGAALVPPAGVTFDTKTGEFSWTPDFTQAGIYKVNFHAKDNFKTSANKLVTITVKDVNQAPVMKPISDVSVTVGDLIEVTIDATDADGDVLTYTVISADNKLSNAVLASKLTGNVFKWTPEAVNVNPGYKVTFGVKDATNPEVTQTINLEIKTNDQDGDTILDDGKDGIPGNSDDDNCVTTANTDQADSDNDGKGDVCDNDHAPLITVANQTVNEGELLTFKVNVTDSDVHDTHTFEVLRLPSGSNFDKATGVLTWTPSFTQSGEHVFAALAIDSQGVKSVPKEIKITVIDVNQKPVFKNLGDISTKEGDLVEFKVQAEDKDAADSLTYTAVGTLSAQFNPTTQTFSWTPTFDDAGIHTVTFNVSDGKDTLSQTIQIRVDNVNQAPTMGLLEDKNIKENELVSFDVVVADADNQPLSVSVTGLPEGAVFQNNKFTWTPSFTQGDVHGKTYDLTFTVTDGAESVSQTITITVENINRAPVITSTPSAVAKSGNLYSYQVIATDADGEELTYSVSQNPVDGISITKDGLVRWYPSYSGSSTITVSVTDGTDIITQTWNTAVTTEHSNIKISNVRVGPEFAYPGEPLSVSIDMSNGGNVDFEDVSATVMVYDLGIYRSIGGFDLMEGDSVNRNLHVQLPYDAPQGVYLVKVTVGNDEFHETSYRQFRVI